MSNKSPKRKPKKISKQRAERKSSYFGTVLTIVGLVLAVVALISLRPQVNVSPADALDHSQPFSVPFHITNASFYAIDDVQPTFYIHRLMISGVNAGENLVGFSETKTLEHAESATVMCNFTPVEGLPQDADVVLVIDYRVWWIPFWHPRQYFRFVGRYGDNWQWLSEPIGTVRKDTDAAFEHDRQLREMFRLHPPGSH